MNGNFPRIKQTLTQKLFLKRVLCISQSVNMNTEQGPDYNTYKQQQ